MANKELTALPAVGTLAGTQVLYLVDENNNSRKVALSDLAQWIKTAASIVPSSNPWKGARVRRTADLSIAHNTSTFVTWQAADADTSAFWSAGAPTRFTIPAGVTKVRLTSTIRWASATTPAGFRQGAFFKNGVTFHGRGTNMASALTGSGNGMDLQVVSSVVSVVAGDYFEHVVFHTQGAALNVLANESTWFQIEVVEGQ